MLSANNARALFDRRRAAWLAEDVEGYLALFADDLEITVPGRPEPLRGREAYERMVRRSFAWAQPRSFDFHHLAVTGDVVLAEWTISVETREAGDLLSWRGMSACRLRDGQIAWWREYWDPAGISPR